MKPTRKVFQEKYEWKKLGGNADACENKGVVKIATQKNLKTKELKIDCLRKTLWVGEEGRGETETLSAEPWIYILPHPLLFVKWEIKGCGLNGLWTNGRPVQERRIALAKTHEDLHIATFFFFDSLLS